jgi:hypothetical protein
MTIPVFPTMPLLVYDGYKVQPQQNVRRTTYEHGAPRQAPINCRQLVHRVVRYHLCSVEEYEAFRLWVRDEIKFGARWFLWRCPEREKMGLQPFLRSRILEGKIDYEPSAKSFNSWEANFTLETWDAQ